MLFINIIYNEVSLPVVQDHADSYSVSILVMFIYLFVNFIRSKLIISKNIL